MKKTIIGLFIIFCSQFSYAAWVNLNTGINDNLTGVVFWGTNGLVSGSKGLYFTNTGGSGASSWNRFNITGNYNDSLLYNRVKFTDAYSENISGFGYNKAFVCGYDSVLNQAIIMQINFPVMTYSFVYIGSANTRLNKMTYCNSQNSYYAVGDNGLIINFSSSSASIVSSSFNYNLTSISFSGNQFFIGTNGHLISGTNNSNIFSYTIFNTPSSYFKDVVCTGYNYGYSVGNSYYKSTGLSPIDQPNYDYGTLNANTLLQHNGSSSHYVGTDHGIFKSDNLYAFLEWQPSSFNYTINDFWFNTTSSSVLYACGNTGVVLTTNDNGGITKPVAKINLLGGCLGTNISIGGVTGTSTSCAWYINNTLSYSNCGSSFIHNFSSVGQYTIQVNVANSSGLYDTAVQVINIVDYPKINKPVSVNKNILCHQEPIVVSIDSSQLNVFYKLKLYGSASDYGYSGNGNASIINFTSTPLSVTGNYYLQATSSLANCYKNFTDTIKIAVEKTTADFHVATINTNPNEFVNCYQHCTDAQNYSWSFSPSANIASSSAISPSVSFSSVGPTQIKLIAWSNNGCYDSIQKSGPTVYNEPLSIDSCWNLVNNGSDASWPGTYKSDIAQLYNSKTGFITVGSYYTESFASRYGDSLRLPNNQGGGFVSKYNKNGVLKWMAYSKQAGYDFKTFERDIIKSVVEDKLGNVYLCGLFYNYFYDNKGDSILIETVNSTLQYNYAVIKLDSTGKFLWKLRSTAFEPEALYIDHSDNLVVFTPTGTSSIDTLKLNGVPVYTLSNPSSTFINQTIIKIKPTGVPIWHTSQQVNSPSYNNQSFLANISFDAANNIYMTGVFQYSVNFYSAGSSVANVLPATPGGRNIYIVKFDSSGIFKWKMKSYGVGGANYDLNAYCITVDSVGNSYLSGSNNNYVSSFSQKIESTNSSTSSYNLGRYFVAKINPNGICQWMQGCDNSYYGTGYAVYQKGNEVSVLGQVSNNSYTVQTSVFSSQNNINAALSIESGDYFVAVYDTLGNLKKIISNGNNPPAIIDWGFNGFYREQNGSYMVNRDIRLSQYYMNFGSLMSSTKEIDGSVSRFTENCGIVIYPSIATALSNENNKSNLTIYPNPTKNLIYIKGLKDMSNISIELINSIGQKVVTSVNGEVIDVCNQVSGIYFLLIYKDQKLYHQQKIIKE